MDFKLITSIIFSTLLSLLTLGQSTIQLEELDLHPDSVTKTFVNIDTIKVYGLSMPVINTLSSSLMYIEDTPQILSISTTLQITDTVICGNKVYAVSNPFPDVFITYDTVYLNEEQNHSIFVLNPVGEPTLEIYNNGQIKSICVLQTLEGTIKWYFDKKGRKIIEGRFVRGHKTGVWLYYSKSGRIKRTQKYS